MTRNIFILSGIIIACWAIVSFNSGCAQVGMPTGGPTDTLAPVLVRASPENFKLNFTGNRITLVFDEYIEVRELQSNLLVSPFPKTNPTINNNLKTISIKFKDTLRPNTTYSINFGNAIVDVHEANILKDFSYTFSTGDRIDSLELRGKVLLAETGKTDSTFLVFLYQNAVDSEVVSRKPDYVTRLNGAGEFKFSHLPEGNFKIYALKDGDGGKTYNGKTEGFAFRDSDVNTAESNSPIVLFAYAEETANVLPTGAPSQKPPAEKKLRFTSSAGSKQQDILLPLEFNFTNGLKTFDGSKIVVSDTNYKRLANINPTIDSTRKKVTVNIDWQPETEYVFIMPADAFEDSVGNFLEKSDSFRFSTKKLTDYGSLQLRFKNLDLTKHPVIQFLQNNALKSSFPVTSSEWSNKRFPPGEYEVRILYDINNNGVWDPGNYKTKLQPERAISLPQQLGVKADWENEREIQL